MGSAKGFAGKVAARGEGWGLRSGGPWALVAACLVAWATLFGPGAAYVARADTVKIEISAPAGAQPALVLVLSLVVPGLGQIVLGHTTRGIWIFAGAVGLLVVGVVLAGIVGTLLGGVGWICAPLVGLAYLVYAVWAGLDAFHLAKGPPAAATPRRSKRTRRPRHLQPLRLAPPVP